MNILMMTNTYLPFIGGVERSVQTFSEEYRKRGHKVVIVAPDFENNPENEIDVIRVPAIQHFNGTDFSVQLPIPGVLNAALKDYKPDLVHSHHPFMIGDSALRAAAQFQVPIVFTFHTFFESYTHYVPGDSQALKRFVAVLATGYANLCNSVFAPSNYVAEELRRRGVVTPINVVPTGISLEDFSNGDGRSFRKENEIPEDAFVVGFVSRLAPEKNMEFLVKGITRFMLDVSTAHFIIVGSGPSKEFVKTFLNNSNIFNRVHFYGTLTGKDLTNAYDAMDVFAYASQTETQGLVLTEAMAASVPVVAIDGPVIREVVKDFENGRVLDEQNVDDFSNALKWVSQLNKNERKALRINAKKTSIPFSKEKCADRALRIYSELVTKQYRITFDEVDSSWSKAKRMIKAELDLLKNMTKATGAAIKEPKNVDGAPEETD